jgi:hypothetical protein
MERSWSWGTDPELANTDSLRLRGDLCSQGRPETIRLGVELDRCQPLDQPIEVWTLLGTKDLIGVENG